MEIGSEFYLEEKYQSRDKNLFNRIISSYHSLGAENIFYCGSGRSALILLIDTILKEQPEIDSIILPAFLCESIIHPFLSRGIKCYFYKVNLLNDYDLELIEPLLRNNCIFYYIDYFGFENDLFTDKLCKLKKKWDFILVNDITHSLFTKKKIAISSDFYIASIRKWLGVPSGGILLNNSKLKIFKYEDSKDTDFSRVRLVALKSKKMYMRGLTGNKENFLRLFSDGEKILENYSQVLPMDEISQKIISNYDYDKMINQRRKNYNVLLKGINENSNLKILNKHLGRNTCPMFFVIRNNKRSGLQQYLVKNHIYAPIHWPKPKVLENCKINFNDREYRELLSIPCDQRYSVKDMKRVAEIINVWSE